MTTSADLKIRLVTDKGTFVSDAQAMARAARDMGEQMTRAMGGAAASAKIQQAAFDRLRASVDPAFVSSQRFAEIQQRVAGFVQAGVVSQRAANIVLEQAAAKYMGVATAAQRAEAAQREAATASQMSRQSYESLRASVDPLYATSRRYEAALETLNAAQRAGIITDAERQRTQGLLETQLLSTNRAASVAGAGTNRLGSAMVNAGFQVQDFAVQVASGQSAMIAFAQQAPQLLGVLGFTGKLAMIGAGLGTFIAVGMAVAPMLFDMGSKAKSASEAVDDLSAAVSEYRKFADMAKASSEDLRAQFGALGDRAGELAKFMGEIAQIEALDKANSAMETLFATFGKFDAAKKVWAADGILGSIGLAGMGSLAQITEYEKGLGKLRTEFDLTEAEARLLADGLAAVVSASDVSGQMEAVRALSPIFLQVFGSLKDVPPQLRNIAMQAGIIAHTAGEILDPVELTRLALEKQEAAAADIVGQYDRQADMSRAVARYGKESAQVEELRRAEAMRVAEAFIKQEGLTGTIAEGVRKAAIAAFDASLGADQAAAALSRAEVAARALASALASAAGFTVSLEQQGRVLEAQIQAHAKGVNVAIAGMVEQQKIQAETLRDAAVAQAQGDWAAVEAADAQYAASLRLIEVNAAKQASLNALNSAKGKAGGAAAKHTKELQKEALALKASLDPLEAYRQEMANLAELRPYLTDGEWSQAVSKLNAELASSLPLVDDLTNAWADFVMSGFSDIDSLGDAFKGLIRQMITDATRNQIMFNLGFGGSLAGGAGAAMAGGGGAGGLLGGLGNAAGGVGILGKIGGAVGGFMSGIWSGVTAAFSGVNSFFAIGANALQASALTGASTLATTIGAALGPIALVAFAVSALIGKTKLLNQGIAVTVDGFDALVQTFQTTKKSYLFGLVSSRAKTSYADAPAELADPIMATVAQIQKGVLGMADILGYSADTFAKFAHSLEVSTMGMTDEEAAAAVQEALADMSDGFADMIDGLDGMRLEGEGATDALTRLSAALSAVNPVMDTLGHSFRAAGLLGAGLASDLVMAFGGLDAFGQATARYYEVFYGEAERVATATRQATEALADLGGIMPRTRDEYRAIIEGLDVTTEAGRDLYAAMVSMSDVFDFILPKVSSLSAELEAMVTGISTGVDAMIAEATAAARANEQAAATWYKAASSIRDYIDRLRGTAGALISARDARAYNEARYQTMLAAAMGGDIGATQGLTGAAQALLDSTKATARTRVDLARAEARVLADLGLVQGVADIEGARHDVIAGLLGEQIALLEEVKGYLAGGGALDPAQIEALSGQLGALGEAIKAAEMINYAFLKERLEVSVDVLADADVPPYLRKLIKDAQTGIAANIDFITRSDLPADMKWLALTGESELLKTVDFAIGTTLPENLRWLAVQTASTLNKTVNMLAGSKLDTETLRLALAGNSELARTVNAALAADIDPEAKRLALGNLGAYSVAVQASLMPGLPADVRRIVLAQQGGYAAMIRGAISANISDNARRVLLWQQGRYTANIVGVLAANMSDPTKRLLLEANTNALRSITVAAVFANDLTADQRAALSADALEVGRVIRAAIDLAGLSATGALYLAQIGLGDATVQKGLIGSIALAALSDDQRALLGAINETVTKSVAFKATGSATEDQVRLLGAVSASILRQVSFKATGWMTDDQRDMLGAVGATVQRLLALSATGTLTWQQQAMLAAAAGTVARTVALTATGSLTDDQRRVLLTAAGSLSRSLALTTTGALTTDQRSVLTAAHGAFARVLALTTTGGLTSDQRLTIEAEAARIERALSLVVTGTLTDDQRRALVAVNGTTWRTLNVYGNGALTADQRGVLNNVGGNTWRNFNVWSAGVLTKDQSAVLHHVGDKTWRTFNLWSQGGLTDDQRRVITMTSGTTWRTVKAAVDMTALNDRQKSLLDAISGGSVGKLTLGGTFVFDPASGFKTWYEATTKAAMTVPMDSLRTSLGALATALREETARQVAASADLSASLAAESKSRAIATAMGGLTFDPSATYTSGDGWTGTGAYKGDWTDMYRLAGALGVDLRWKTGVAKSAEQMRLAIEKAMRDAGLIGLDEMLWLKSGATNTLDADNRWFEWLKAQGVPGFASGGLHTGGLRMVGENGPELEATGPARIYSASQTRAMLSGGGDNGEMVAELRALRAEVAAFKEEQRQLGLQTATNTERTRKTLGKWDAVGAPVTGVGGRPVQTEGV